MEKGEEMKKRKQKTSFTFKRLWQMTDPPTGQLLLALVLSIFQTGASLSIPLLVKNVIDSLPEEVPLATGAFVLLLFGLQVLSSALSLFLLTRAGEKIIRRLRDRLWEKLLFLPVKYYDEHESGKMISRVTNDTTAVMNLLSSEIVQFATSVITVIVSVFILFSLDVPMTAVMLSAVPLMLLIVIPIGRKIYKISYGKQEKMSELTGFLTGMLAEIRLIKAYNTESKEMERGKGTFRSLYDYGVAKAKIESILQPLMGTLMMAIFIGVVGFGAYRVSQGSITSGELVAFILYLFQIIVPFSTMSRFITSFQDAKGAGERLFQILHEDDEPELGIQPEPKPDRLVFDNVSFGYEDHQVLKDVSFEAERGTLTAFVGPSGAGKTTIFALMERFYEPDKGEMKLGDIPHDQFNLSQWRRFFGYVPQESPLLAGTIKDNILYGVEREVSDGEMMEAAKKANAHEFIAGLPNQYMTEVGERGHKLSGGQRQRIAIARAFLRNPEFLLLDEATSSLDSESERMIQEALHELLKGRTAFVIAHRLSTVIDADRIIVLQDGMVTGIGTHAELMENHAFYQLLVQQQFKREPL
ncbi:ABC transporter ATP-binding protein [Bacillus marinisedimentorum]|uniref:ABC transporter ATP-binding protein n=1 Tax=Bacillus marinisedimentorum TaxID=1821260 RepID=UPI0009F19BAD|nr:ABC transporter ATP-binding protein [Bacillus marinisedimentorum]